MIYEVNLEVKENIKNEFLDWLQTHMKSMISVPGFQSANAFDVLDDDPIFKIRVQYKVDSLKSLNHYFAHKAKNVRQEMILKFGDKIQTERRILRPIESF